MHIIGIVIYIVIFKNNSKYFYYQIQSVIKNYYLNISRRIADLLRYTRKPPYRKCCNRLLVSYKLLQYGLMEYE